MTDLTVVPFKREPKADAIAAMEEIIAQMKSGEIPEVESGGVVLMGNDGSVHSFGFGEKCEDLHLVGLFRLGEQLIIDDCLSAE